MNSKELHKAAKLLAHDFGMEFVRMYKVVIREHVYYRATLRYTVFGNTIEKEVQLSEKQLKERLARE